MKTINLLTILTTLTAFTGPALADDADDVRAAIEKHYYLFQTGDLEASMSKYHLDDFTMFLGDGGVLWETDYDSVAGRMGAKVDIPHVNVRMTNFKAQMYDDVAVVTFFLVGTYGEGDKTRQVTNRASAVWIKTSGEWKEAHHHESQLNPQGL
jgi:ketosteroid isomerase-like protein